MKNDLGFLCLDLRQTAEHNTLINVIKQIIDHNPFNQVCMFNTYSSRTGYENVPVLPLSHSKFFDGNLFMFDILSLNIAASFPGIRKKYYYCSDTIWAAPNSYYSAWKNLLKDKNLQIITTDPKLHHLYKVCWDIDTKNINTFSYKEIIDAIQQTE